MTHFTAYENGENALKIAPAGPNLVALPEDRGMLGKKMAEKISPRFIR